ncbi:hypothetical protein [Hippea jasoniae]|uniref:hypothetical protein n=1 Tax=Hippea jasoniae TaxID=944479 RepID=UPI0005568B81|nr:hypothetical protein [Hippea jasoniae]
MKRLLSVMSGVVFFVTILFSSVSFAKFHGVCKVQNRTANVNRVSGVIDFGKTVFMDGKGGWKGYIKFPSKFKSDLGTWSKNNIHTIAGTVRIKLKVKVAGVRKYGIWRKKQNLIQVSLVREGNGGKLVAYKQLNVYVSNPKYKTIELPAYAPDLEAGNEVHYRLEIHVSKNVGGSKTCKYRFTVVAD